MAGRSIAKRRIRSRIDRQVIVAAALELADHQGLDAISMRAIATELDVVPMALYRHVANKDDLLDGLVEALLESVPTPSPELEWREQMRQLAAALRRVGHQHPGVFPLLLGRPAISPAAHRPVEALLQILEKAGVPPRKRVALNHLITTYVLGFVASEVSGRFARGTRPARERLASLAPKEFPAHRRVATYLADVDWTRDFSTGIELLMQAVATEGKRR